MARELSVMVIPAFRYNNFVKVQNFDKVDFHFNRG